MTTTNASTIPIRIEDQSVWQQRLIAGQAARLRVAGPNWERAYTLAFFHVQSQSHRTRYYRVTVQIQDGIATHATCDCTSGTLGVQPCKHLALAIQQLNAWPFLMAVMQELPLGIPTPTEAEITTENARLANMPGWMKVLCAHLADEINDIDDYLRHAAPSDRMQGRRDAYLMLIEQLHSGEVVDWEAGS